MYNLPTIRKLSHSEKYWEDIIIMSIYDTYELFDELYYRVYYYMCACWEVKECIKYPLKFKFYPEDKEIYELTAPKFLLNINAWRPLIELHEVQKYYQNKIEVLDESFIVGVMMSETLREGLVARVMQELTDYGISFERRSELVQTVIERYQQASIEFALVDTRSVLTYENTFLDGYRANEKIRELNNLVIPQTMQTADVEQELTKRHKELLTELDRTQNPLRYISRAGNHIKDKQVQELFISFGQIPDISGNVIPYTMQGNGFSTGYVDPATYFIAASGARLSAIMNTEYMGDAGYLSRNLVLMSGTLKLSRTMFDCGTQHLLPLTVTDNRFLHRLENKWFCETLGAPLQLLHYADHRHLIGQRIWVRSLLTCAGGDEEVCHVCYGRDSMLVMNMPGMAIFNTEVYSEPVSQNILSTKHLLYTEANKLLFNTAFDKYFQFNAGDVYLKEREEWGSTIPTDGLSVRIDECNVIPVNQYDTTEHNTFGNQIESPFYVYNKKTKEYESVEIINYESMFIDAESMKSFEFITEKKTEKNYYEITFDALSEEMEGRLLSIDIKNHGLTDNLKMIMKLLDKEAGKYESYSELAQTFFDALISAGIKCRHVQAEVILNRLIRDTNNIYSRPDFKQFKHPDFVILRLNKALLNTNSPTIGLSYQEIRRQLLSDNLYQKDGKSYLDPLYASTIPTDRFKELYKIRKESEK